jgi:Glyoxalase-like domain
MLPAVEIDHVLIAVADLDGAARELEARYGLRSTTGGRHPGWGTANRIVPLGDAYLELVAVVDPAEAGESAFGRWVAASEPRARRLLGWAVRTKHLSAHAERLGLRVVDGSRETTDGRTLRWRLAGVEEAAAEPALPFFIEWEAGTPHPGATAVADHRIAELQLTADRRRLDTWLGPHDLPIRVEEGPPAIMGVVIDGPGGPIALSTGRICSEQSAPICTGPDLL